SAATSECALEATSASSATTSCFWVRLRAIALLRTSTPPGAGAPRRYSSGTVWPGAGTPRGVHWCRFQETWRAGNHLRRPGPEGMDLADLLVASAIPCQ